MTALGELLIFIIYLILGIPLLIVIFREVIKRRKSKTVSIKRILFAALPLVIWASWMYYVKRSDELGYVGKYKLTKYPNCDACFLELKNNNVYQVTGNGKTIEKGEWSYSGGGDYWIVDIGDHEQLGSGKFSYSEKVD